MYYWMKYTEKRTEGIQKNVARQVMIVDDSRVGRRLVRRCIPDDWDAEIIEVSGGQQAIDTLASRSLDVVFLDLTMPEVDGYAVLQWIKESEFDPIVIVVSGDLQPEAKVRVLLLGAFEFLGKPTTVDEVSAVLKLAGVLN